MTIRSPEQHAADAALTEALQAVLEAYGLAEEGEVILDYGIIVHQQSMEMMDAGASAYCTIFKDNNTPTHAALGLFQTGINRVTEDA